MPDEVVTQNPNESPTEKPNDTPVSWRDSLAPDLKVEKSLEKFQDVGSLAKSYIELEKMNGNSVRLPTDTSKPEEWEQLYNRLGRPEKPEGYKLEKPKVMPKGLEWSDVLEKDLRSFAHKQGWNQAQAQHAVEKWHDTLSKMVEAQKYTVERGKQELMSSLGEEKSKAVVEACNKAVAEFGDDEFTEFLDESGFGNHPAVIKFLSKMGQLVSEEAIPKGEPASGGMSAQEAKLEISRIRNDKDHPYHKGDRSALDRMAELYTYAYGNQAVLNINA